MSTFFSDFAAFFGFSEGPQHASISDMVSDLVARHVDSHLATNQSSLTAYPLPSAHGPVQSGTDPLPDLGDRQSVQSLEADVSVGGSRGQVRSKVSLAQDVYTLDPPSTGKRPRPPKDVPWRVKRSRPEVGGSLAPVRPGLPTGRDQDGGRRAARDPDPHPQAQGEGQAVSDSSSGIVTRQTVQLAQPEGGVMHVMHSLLPQSTKHSGTADHVRSS